MHSIFLNDLSTQNSDDTFFNRSFFVKVSGKSLAIHLKSLKNRIYTHFIYILNYLYLYNGGLQENTKTTPQIKDLKSLIDFKEEIDNHEGITDKIKIYNLNVLSKKLEEIIEKLEKFRDQNLDKPENSL